MIKMRYGELSEMILRILKEKTWIEKQKIVQFCRIYDHFCRIFYEKKPHIFPFFAALYQIPYTSRRYQFYQFVWKES